jgi:putative PIN family toxin of toxin-antitoxin system
VICAVVDTNVLVSAMISAEGNEALLILAVNQGLVAPCFSDEILNEYSEVLLRPKFAFPSDEVDALLGLLRRLGHRVSPVPIARVSPDPDDDKFIACAVAGNAEFLVTGNKRHFPQTDRMTAKVVNAAELLEVITLEL